MFHNYPNLNKLRSGEIVMIEGVKFIKDEGELKPGDTYIAERNTAPVLLTCYAIVEPPENIIGGKWVSPKEKNNYPYDLHECVKVKMVD